MGENPDRLEEVLATRRALASGERSPGHRRRDWMVALMAVVVVHIVVFSIVGMYWKGFSREAFPAPESPQAVPAHALDEQAHIPSPGTAVRPREVSRTAGPEEVGSGPFVVLEAVVEESGVRFRRHRMHGVEHTGASADARRRVPSMHQRDFPEPESGCGPTAMVNWLLWLQNEGLLRKPVDGPDLQLRANYNFQAVERELYGLRGSKRNRTRGGSNINEITAGMDRLAYALSAGSLRMHFVQFEAPLRIEEWIEFTSGYRAGILVVRVVEDPVTRRLSGYHAVSLVAGDNGGGVMLNNWGEKVYGTLRNQPDGQFFYPQNVNQPALKVEKAVCFIPFRPFADVPVAKLEAGAFTRGVSVVSPSRATITRRPATTAPSPASPRRFKVDHVWSGWRKDAVFQITNVSPSSQTVYLKTFQAAFPGGKVFYPTDLRVAERIPQGYGPGNSGSRLLIRPGESRLIWFQFSYLQAARSGGVRSLIETP